MNVLDEEIAGETSPHDAPDMAARAEQFTKAEPMQALGAAAGAGVLFALLPVGKITWALVRLALKLTRPALMVLGAAMVYQEINRRSGSGERM